MDPGQHLAELYQILISPDQSQIELIDQVQKELIELYKKPETLEILINFYPQAKTSNFRVMAAIGIKQILSNKDVWTFLRENNQSEAIKGALLQILQNEQDSYTFENVVESVSPILKTDFMVWPEYLELAQTYASNERKNLFSIMMANSLINSMINNLTETDTDFLDSTWDFFTNLAMQGLSSSDEKIIKLSSDLVSNLFAFAETNDDNLPELFSALFQVFSSQIEKGSQVCNSMVDSFEKISEVPDFCFPNTAEIAEQFLPLVMNPEYKIDLRCLLIKPLISFIFSDEETDKSNFLGTIYEVIFAISSNIFIEDECKDEQEGMLICNDNLETLLERCKGEDMRQIILDKSPESSSKGEIITYGLSLISFAQRYPELLLHNISACIKFGFACIEADDHTIQETGFELFQTLFERQNEAYFGIQDHLFEIIVKSFGNDHQPLLTKILKCLYVYIDQITIKKEHFDNLFQVLFQVLKEYEQPEIQNLVIDCFTVLVKSIADEISPYAAELFPLVIQAATEANKPELSELKASAVECLGMLVQYSKGITEVEPILQIFVDCLSSDEEVLKSAGFEALTNSVKAQISEVGQILPPALAIALSIIQTVPSLHDDVEKEDKNQIMLDMWQSIMTFIEEVCNKAPQCLQEHLAEFKEALHKLIKGDCHLDIECMSIKTSSVLITLFPPEEIQKFLRKVVKILISTNSPKIASLCFELICEFMNKRQKLEIEIGENIISSACEVGINAMKRNLAFQDDTKNESEFDVDFSSSLYYFFEEIAQHAPSLFPLNDFWNSAKSILDKGIDYEQAEIILVLCVVFTTSFDNIPSILKKKIVNIFVAKLEICDCYNPPYPIGAVRSVVDKDPSLIEKYIPDIMEYIDQILAIESEDQSSYSITMDYTVSLLFSLFSEAFKDKFEVDKYLPTMLQLMPATTDQAEALNCYENLVFLCGEYSEVMGHYASEVVRILSQTFALKEKEWNIISLPRDTLKKMAILLNNLVFSDNSMVQGKKILEASVPNELAMQRFQQRFTSSLNS